MSQNRGTGMGARRAIEREMHSGFKRSALYAQKREVGSTEPRMTRQMLRAAERAAAKEDHPAPRQAKVMS